MVINQVTCAACGATSPVEATEIAQFEAIYGPIDWTNFNVLCDKCHRKARMIDFILGGEAALDY